MQLEFWDKIFESITILPLDLECVIAAVNINSDLKLKSSQISIVDLFIASTAVTHGYSIATLNKKHFERIINLSVIQ